MKYYKNKKKAVKQNQKLFILSLVVSASILGFTYFVSTPGIDTGNWYPLENVASMPTKLSSDYVTYYHGFPLSYLADMVYHSTNGMTILHAINYIALIGDFFIIFIAVLLISIWVFGASIKKR